MVQAKCRHSPPYIHLPSPTVMEKVEGKELLSWCIQVPAKFSVFHLFFLHHCQESSTIQRTAGGTFQTPFCCNCNSFQPLKSQPYGDRGVEEPEHHRLWCGELWTKGEINGNQNPFYLAQEEGPLLGNPVSSLSPACLHVWKKPT